MSLTLVDNNDDVAQRKVDDPLAKCLQIVLVFLESMLILKG